MWRPSPPSNVGNGYEQAARRCGAWRGPAGAVRSRGDGGREARLWHSVRRPRGEPEARVVSRDPVLGLDAFARLVHQDPAAARRDPADRLRPAPSLALPGVVRAARLGEYR